MMPWQSRPASIVPVQPCVSASFVVLTHLLFFRQPLTPKADIYSLGMILYSAVAAKKPYDSSVESVKVARKTGARPEIDARWHTGFMEVGRSLTAVSRVASQFEEHAYYGVADKHGRCLKLAQGIASDELVDRRA